MRLVSWIKSLLRPTRPIPSRFTSSRTKSDLSRASVFVGPHYDELTERMVKWLVALREHAGLKDPVFLVGAEATHSNLRRVLGAGGRSSMLVVYYGHGEAEAFLTGLGQGFARCPKHNGHDLLCVVDDFPADIACHVVGYCCFSALQLGKTIRSRKPGNRFLGFLKPLLIPLLDTQETLRAFESPMLTAIGPAIASGELDSEAPSRLYQAFSEEYETWFSNPPPGEDAHDLVCMCIDHNRMAIDQTI